MDILKIYRTKSKIYLAQTALHLEGIHLDDVQTKDLLDKQTHKCFEVDEDDAIVMRNVVAALDFLETINMKQVSIDLDLYIKLNALLAIDQALETGHLRNQPVSIGCIPEDIEVFDKSLIEHEIKRIADITETDFREVIPDAFCRLARMQPFFDGNKRTTAFLCNVSLLKKGLGLFIINDEKLGRFNALLFEYYTGKNNDILEFIGNECIISVEQLAKEPSDAESDDECSSPSP